MLRNLSAASLHSMSVVCEKNNNNQSRQEKSRLFPDKRFSGRKKPRGTSALFYFPKGILRNAHGFSAHFAHSLTINPVLQH